MLYQIVDPRPPPVVLPENPPPTPPSPAVLAANRRRQNYTNHYSEHDNRNIIQSYGEYFGRGFGKRLIPASARQKTDSLIAHHPIPVAPDRSVTQRDFRGWPGLEPPQLVVPGSTTSARRRSTGAWMTSCYDDVGRRIEPVPNYKIYRDDYKRLPIHPWHY